MPSSPGWSERLAAAWYGRRPVWRLVPLSLLFAALAALRRLLFRSGLRRTARLAVPVVVVGNLTVGGTGKTPVVIALVDALRAAGHRPGVLTRGHGGRWRGPALVAAATTAAECGDEALLIARSCGVPVAVAQRRAEAGALLLREYPETDLLVCDDGLQHYALARDVELAVVERSRGFGNGWLLPAGPLREPLGRLATVAAVLAHGEAGDAAAARRLEAVLAAAPRVWALGSEMGAPRRLCDGVERAWEAWRGETVDALAAIGDPGRFFAALRTRGLVVRAHAFPDHHAYTRAELEPPGDAPVLMTGKDAVKCAPTAQPRHWVVPYAARLPQGLVPWLLELLETARGREDP